MGKECFADVAFLFRKLKIGDGGKMRIAEINNLKS
jgi:hypothetical protein